MSGSWVGDPDFRSHADTDVPLTERRRHGVARRAVMRALIGHGARPVENRTGDSWDVEGLPLGGRVRVSGAKSKNRRLLTLAWVREHQERRHWSAVVWLNWGVRQGLTVHMSLEDWALVVGRLAWLERERKRWLDSAPDHHV